MFTAESANDLTQWVQSNKEHHEPIIAELANSISDYIFIDVTSQRNGLHNAIQRATVPIESGAAPRPSEILSRVTAELGDRNFLTDVQLELIMDAMNSDQPNNLFFGNHTINNLKL